MEVKTRVCENCQSVEFCTYCEGWVCIPCLDSLERLGLIAWYRRTIRPTLLKLFKR